ncbi:MAG: GHKL domain-containing protein, partial [Coprobacillus cateniformis]
MGSLLGNLFENAIAGCQDLPKSQRQIQFRSYVKNNHLIIIIENPLLIPLQMQNNIYLSTKHKGYGLGIQSIQNIVH